MDILYLLIPVSVVLVLAILAVFGWAVHADQFDDLDREGARIVGESGETAPDLDADQARHTPAGQESPSTTIRIREANP